MKTIFTTIFTFLFATVSYANIDLKGDHKAIFNAYNEGSSWIDTDRNVKSSKIGFGYLSCRISGTPENPGSVKCDGNQAFNRKPEAFRGEKALKLYKALLPNFTHACNANGCVTNEIYGVCSRVRAPFVPLPIYSYKCAADYFCYPEQKAQGICDGTSTLKEYQDFNSY